MWRQPPPTTWRPWWASNGLSICFLGLAWWLHLDRAPVLSRLHTMQVFAEDPVWPQPPPTTWRPW